MSKYPDQLHARIKTKPDCPICELDDKVRRARNSANVQGVFYYCSRCDECFGVSEDVEVPDAR